MNTAGEIAVVMVVLWLIAGGSAIAWVYLFYLAGRAERANPPTPATSPPLGEKR
ncbi:MAG: hypothetical protein ACRENY_07850 [Candidatus Dormibacteria bacterium]